MIKYCFSILVSCLYSWVSYGETLDLKSLTELVLLNNYDLKIAKSKELEKAGAFVKAKGDFDFGLNYDFSYTDSDTPSSSSLDGGGAAASVKSSALSHSLTLSKTFGTGTEVRLPYIWNINQSTSSFKIFKKSHETSMAFSITQPLLRVFSKGYFTKSLDNTELDWLIEKAKSDSEIENGIKKALEKFFDAHEMYKAHAISLNGLNTAKDNFEFVKAKRKVGSSSFIEQLDAESSYQKSIEKELKDKNKLKKTLGELGILVYGKHDVEIKLAKINIDDYIIKIPAKHEREEIIQNAISRRQETFSKLKSLEKAKNISKQSKVDLLPTMDLDYSYTSSGLSSTRVKSDNEVFDKKFVTTKVGLTVARDIFQYAAKGSYQTNKIKAQQEQLKYDQHLQDISLEIHSVLADLESQETVVAALRASVKAEQEKVKYRLKQFKQGKLSSFELSKQQESKEKSELQLVKAEMSFLKKVFSFHHSQGGLSEKLLQN
jgi:outer membrane protein TolC